MNRFQRWVARIVVVVIILTMVGTTVVLSFQLLV